MSEMNAAIVREGYEAFNSGDWEAIYAGLDEDVEYVNPEGAVDGGTRRGRDEMVAALHSFFDQFAVPHLEPERVVAVDDKVAARVRFTARGRSSGVPLDQVFGHLHTLRVGKTLRFEWFHNPADAFEAVEAPPEQAAEPS